MATPEPTRIPDKLYFKIGEVARLLGVEPHVLRYWEREVSAIRPVKSRSNQRRYRRRDVELFFEVRRLLYDEKVTLAGVRQRVLAAANGDEAMTTLPPERLQRIREGLHGLIELCRPPPPAAHVNPE